MNRLKKIYIAVASLFFAATLAVAAIVAGDKLIQNDQSNKDLVFQIKKSSTMTEVLRLIGSTAGAQFTSTSGTLGVSLKNGTGATVLDVTQTEDTGTDINSHESTSARNLSITQGALGVVGNLVDGAWTQGPSGFTGVHTINGNMTISGTAGTGNVLHGCTRRTNTVNNPAVSVVASCTGNEVATGGGCTYSGTVPGGLIDNALLASSHQCQWITTAGTSITAIVNCCNK